MPTKMNNSIVVVKTAAQWAADTTTVLSHGQLAVESDTGLSKVGDGTNVYSALQYVQIYPTIDSGNALGA